MNTFVSICESGAGRKTGHVLERERERERERGAKECTFRCVMMYQVEDGTL